MTSYSYERPPRRLEHSQRQTTEDHERENSGNWYFCFGDSEPINSYLKNKVAWIWVLPKFVNALLRGIAQVVFANNPFSGILILTGIFWNNIGVGILVFICTCITIITGVIVNIQPKSIAEGHMSFNGVLLASVTGSLWTPLYNESMPWSAYVFVLTGSSFSVLISNGLSNIFSSCKPSIPILAIPFHILVFLTFACLKHNDTSLVSDAINSNQTATTAHTGIEIDRINHTLHLSEIDNFFADVSQNEFYSWNTLQNALVGVALSGGHVFGIQNFLSSLLVFAALLLYSPILTFMCLNGAVIATIVGLFLSPFPDKNVFVGLFAFNGLLSCGATGTFYIFNFYAFLNGTANAICTAVIQIALTSWFKSINMPMFGLPFILSTILFTCVTSNGPQLARAKAVTFPEHQRRKFLMKRLESSQQDVTNRRLLNV